MFRDVNFDMLPNPMRGSFEEEFLNWDDIAKSKKRLTNIIVNRITREVQTKIEIFVRDESMVRRTSTDLFGYNKSKPNLSELEKEIREFLGDLVNLDIIHSFRFNVLEKEVPGVELCIYLNNGSQVHRGVIHFRNNMYKLW